MLTIRYAW